MIKATSNIDLLAQGMIDMAQKRLVQDFPFHARFVATWRVEQDDSVGTMAVTIRNESILLLFAAAFVKSCTLPQLESVLVHEVNHVLFGHVVADPAQFHDQHARMLAEEITVNEWVSGPLPGMPILLAQFPELPPDEDTDTRYQRLARPCDQVTPKPDPGRTKLNETDVKGVPAAPKNGRSKKEPTDPKIADQLCRETVHPLDNHTLWDEAREAGLRGRMVVKVSVAEASEGMASDEWTMVPAAIQNEINRVAGQRAGSFCESLVAGKAMVHWQRVLRRYVRQATCVEPAFHRPPRRFPHLIGIVPGKIHRPARTKVMSVIDTSGSIHSTALGQIAGELKRMSRDHDIIVLECDAAIQAIYPFSKVLSSVRGRGGTDLRPPFQPDILAKIRPSVVVYFTDGYGPAPKHPPRVPVIWCLMPGGKQPAPWGRVIHTK